MVTVWNFIGLLAAVLILPGSLYLLALTAAGILPRRRKRNLPVPVKLCVVIPAHNEEEMIADCVLSLQKSAATACAAGKPQCGLLVVADNCSDRTSERAREAGAQVLIRHDDRLRGKGYALQFGFTHALANGFDAVAVVDGDSQVSLNFISETLDALAAGAGATQCRYRVERGQDSWRVDLADLAFTAFNVLRPRGRHRLGLSCGLFGNGFSLRSHVLEKAPYGAFSIVEDLEYHVQLVRQGIRVRFLDEAEVRGHVPSASDAAAVQRTRWEAGRFRVAREWVPRLAADVFSLRLRSLEPLLELLTLPLGLHAPLVLAASLSMDLRIAAIGWISAVILGTHVAAAAFLSGRPSRYARALLHVPGYILWKLSVLPRYISSSKATAAWFRTDRSS